MTKRIPKKRFEKSELLHGKYLWDMSYETGNNIYLREELRELMRLAAQVVISTCDEQKKAISELESFLR